MRGRSVVTSAHWSHLSFNDMLRRHNLFDTDFTVVVLFVGSLGCHCVLCYIKIQLSPDPLVISIATKPMQSDSRIHCRCSTKTCNSLRRR